MNSPWPVDAHNTVPSGRTFAIPLTVEYNQGTRGKKTGMRAVTVQVSYDDGRTWSTAKVTGSGDRRTATVTHPAGSGYASLRTTAVDSSGNRVEQTIIRAYALRP